MVGLAHSARTLKRHAFVGGNRPLKRRRRHSVLSIDPFSRLWVATGRWSGGDVTYAWKAPLRQP